MLAADHAAQPPRQRHDARHRLVGGLQHRIVVAVDGDVGVHVAVAGVHVQRHPHAAAQHLGVDRAAALDDRRERGAGEHRLQRLQQLLLPRRAQRVVLQQREHGSAAVGLHHVQVLQPVLPQRAHLAQQRQRLLHAVFQQLGAGNLAGVVAAAQRQAVLREEGFQPVDELELVAQRQLDVDALDALGVLAHPRQRDDDVLVDLERVRVARDGRGALAVEPELLARVGAHGDEAFAAAAVGDAHDLAGGARHGRLVVADDVAHQHHLRQPTARQRALALGGVAHGLQVAVVQVLQARQDRAVLALRLGEHEVLDLDDARHAVLRVAEELEAHGAHVRRHAVHDPARAGDQAVAAFLLDAGQAGQELVGDVLAQAFLAEHAAGNVQPLGALQPLAAGVEVAQLEARHLDVVDLAEVVVEPHHL
jgi:hypothetical protein